MEGVVVVISEISSSVAIYLPLHVLQGCSGGLLLGFLPALFFLQSALSHNGEGSGNPLQCSCLENPRDRGAWWAAVYGVAQSRTRLKQLSSSSSSS